MIRALALRLGLALLLFGGGFMLGRWGGAKGPQVIEVGSPQPRAERDLSPAQEVRTVLVTKEIPGVPAPPPVAVPAELGRQVSTTSTALPALAEGGTFHASTFAQLDGGALQFHTVEWLDTPTGRASLGETVTTTQPVSLALPEASPVPRWTALALAALREGRVRPGLMLQASRGPLVLCVGHLDRQSFVGAGLRW